MSVMQSALEILKYIRIAILCVFWKMKAQLRGSSRNNYRLSCVMENTEI